MTDAVEFAKKSGGNKQEKLSRCLDKLAVNFGLEILKIVPGRVSTEVDARLSFDTQATIDKARQLIGLYDEAGIDRQRILIKIAATWEAFVPPKFLKKKKVFIVILHSCLAKRKPLPAPKQMYSLFHHL